VIRLGAAIVILAVVALVVRRAAKTKQAPDAVRIAARAGITRGTLAAVLEVDHRRWLVTVTGSATTVVAELDPVADVLDDIADDAFLSDVDDTLVADTGETAPARSPRRRQARPRSARRARPERTRGQRSRRERVGLVERARRRTTRSFDPNIDGRLGERS